MTKEERLKTYRDYLIMVLDSFDFDTRTGRPIVTVIDQDDEYYHQQFLVNDGLADLIEDIRDNLKVNGDY